ncbi:MAG: DUF11 domain-containing protein, partial [Pyrinomonadaceae bacterium]
VIWNTTSAGCSITGGNSLSCSFGDLNSGDSRTVNVSGTTDAADCAATLDNTATAAADNEAAGTLANNTSSASIAVQCPDLQVTKTSDAATVSATDGIGFTITVSNIGPGVANDVTLSDTLPTNAGLSWSENPNNLQCGISGGILTCNFGTLASGASASVHIVSPTTPDTCGTVTNTATAAAGNERSTDTANNTSTASIAVQCPDVVVTKVADSATVNAGNPIGFTITVNNAGLGVAKSVTLTDSLPMNPGMTWTEVPDNLNCSISPTGVLTCNFGNLAFGDVRTVHVVSPTTPANCGSVSNTATASATNERSSDTGNNTSTATITLTDVTAPVITLIPNSNIGNLWSPNHKYNTVKVTDLVASASDSCSTTLSLSSVYIWKVTSDEPENINSGDGNTFKDMLIANDCKSVDLRAERDGSKNGRVYTIYFKVKDAAGNVGTAQAKVKVPKSQGANGAAVEDPPVYTVTNPNCP